MWISPAYGFYVDLSDGVESGTRNLFAADSGAGRVIPRTGRLFAGLEAGNSLAGYARLRHG